MEQEPAIELYSLPLLFDFGEFNFEGVGFETESLLLLRSSI